MAEALLLRVGNSFVGAHLVEVACLAVIPGKGAAIGHHRSRRAAVLGNTRRGGTRCRIRKRSQTFHSLDYLRRRMSVTTERARNGWPMYAMKKDALDDRTRSVGARDCSHMRRQEGGAEKEIRDTFERHMCR